MKYIKSSDKNTNPMSAEKKQEILFICICILSMSVLTFAQISGKRLIIYGAVLLYLVIQVTCPKEYILPLLLFFLPWAQILKVSPGSFAFTSFAILGLLLRFLFVEKWGIETKHLIVIILLMAVTFISKLLHRYTIGTNYIMFFATMVMYDMLVSNGRTLIRFDRCILFLSGGIIFASVITLVFQNNANLSAYIHVDYDKYNVKRAAGFFGDPNFYSAQIVPAIAGILLIISRQSGKMIPFYLLLAALIAFGITSVSKSFLVCLAILFGFFCLTISVSKPNLLIRFLIAAILIVGVALITGWFSEIIEGYSTRMENSADMNELTTGRDKIWKDYLAYLINNPIEFLFGQGLTTVLVGTSNRASHNTIIQCVYQFGLVGTGILISWLGIMFRDSLSGFANKFQVMVLSIGCYSMWLGLDMVFFDDFFIIFVLYAIGISEICNIMDVSMEKDKTQCKYFRQNNQRGISRISA